MPIELPLSWNAGPELAWNPLELESGGQFIHAPQVPAGLSLEGVRAQLHVLAETAPVVAQGLDAAQLEALGAGDGAILIGSSARISLEGWRPPHKVRNLVRRAAEAAVDEVPVATAGALQDELERVARGGAATLKYIFRARVEHAQRAFVVSAGGRAVGLVTLTNTGAGAWHVEVLVRHPEAPDGAMELLITRIAEVLQGEKQTRLDLGQVAFFVEEERLSGLGVLNRALLAAAPAAVAATGGRFNFEGLRRFKNKFEVEWVPRYFAGWPRLRKRDLRAASDASELGQFIKLGW